MFWILTDYKVYLESRKIQNSQYNIRCEEQSWENDTTWDLQWSKKYHFQKRLIGQLDIYMQNREREK